MTAETATSVNFIIVFQMIFSTTMKKFDVATAAVMSSLCNMFIVAMIYGWNVNKLFISLY